MGGAFFWGDDEDRGEMPGADDLYPVQLVEGRLRDELGLGTGDINELGVPSWPPEARECVVDLLDRLKDRGLT